MSRGLVEIDKPFSENLPSINEVLKIGKARIIKEGKKVALLNFGQNRYLILLILSGVLEVPPC